jgi:hypothetical protein
MKKIRVMVNPNYEKVATNRKDMSPKDPSSKLTIDYCKGSLLQNNDYCHKFHHPNALVYPKTFVRLEKERLGGMLVWKQAKET